MDFFTRTASAAADVFQRWPEGIGGGDPGVRQVGYPVLVGRRIVDRAATPQADRTVAAAWAREESACA
jgi:hypothetical protein